VQRALPARHLVLVARLARHARGAVGDRRGGGGAAGLHLPAVDARAVRQPPGAAAGRCGHRGGGRGAAAAARGREVAAAAPGRVRRAAVRGRIGADARGRYRMTAATDCNLLLATDLAPRCDRATDRAIALARGSRGRAVAATVVEPAERSARNVPRHDLPGWYTEPTDAQLARQRLQREFEGESRRWDVHVGEGTAGDQVTALVD